MNGFKQAFIDQGIDQGFKEGTESKQKELINNLTQSLFKNGVCQTLSEARDKAIKLLQIEQ